MAEQLQHWHVYINEYTVYECLCNSIFLMRLLHCSIVTIDLLKNDNVAATHKANYQIIDLINNTKLFNLVPGVILECFKTKILVGAHFGFL